MLKYPTRLCVCGISDFDSIVGGFLLSLFTHKVFLKNGKILLEKGCVVISINCCDHPYICKFHSIVIYTHIHQSCWYCIIIRLPVLLYYKHQCLFHDQVRIINMGFWDNISGALSKGKSNEDLIISYRQPGVQGAPQTLVVAAKRKRRARKIPDWQKLDGQVIVTIQATGLSTWKVYPYHPRQGGRQRQVKILPEQLKSVDFTPMYFKRVNWCENLTQT